ncbi:MAG TPA: hypothetical protein HPP56_00735 [Nitrospirae bacterium]|nr:hypothetical protein [Nitrospirota bacterium]
MVTFLLKNKEENKMVCITRILSNELGGAVIFDHYERVYEALYGLKTIEEVSKITVTKGDNNRSDIIE